MPKQPEFVVLTPHIRPGCYEKPMTVEQWRKIVEDQAFRCFYCGNFIVHQEAEPDHLIPVSHHGCSCSGNIVASCVRCNRQKQGKLLVDFLAENPRFLKTMGEFSTRIVFIKRRPMFWRLMGVDLRKLGEAKKLA